MKFKKIKDFLTGDYTDRHWVLREKYIHATNRFIKYYYYCRVKKLESRFNADFGISYHDPSAVFKSRPYLPHGLNGIIISRKATIGENATILHQVTVGIRMTSAKSIRPEDVIAPVIGDNVFIGTGAKIIGNIHIGNNVLIGANAVVTKDVPDNYTVIGNPSIMFETKHQYKMDKNKFSW